MAVWHHYPLLEEVAFTRERISATVPLRVVRRGHREGRRNRNEDRCGRCGKKHLFHDSLLRELYFDLVCRGFSAPAIRPAQAQFSGPEWGDLLHAGRARPVYGFAALNVGLEG